MPERVSLAELLQIANKVRAAGGGNPLDALMPAIPIDSHQCLIAKNMNFNCQVMSRYLDSGTREAWIMMLTDKDIRDRIAAALGWETGSVTEYDDDGEDLVKKFYLILPPEIGKVAEDFDDTWRAIREDANGEIVDINPEFVAYIDASYAEASGIGRVVDGKLVL